MGISFSQGPNSLSIPSDPIHAEVPVLQSADINAVYYGQRQAGDFYDFIRVHPERVLFGLFDVAGNRNEALGIISSIQNTFRAAGADLFSRDGINEAGALIELNLQLNRKVLECAQGVHLCPAFVGCYNESLGIVCYCNAGHLPALVREGTQIAELSATGLPLGLFSHFTCDAPMRALTPGAALLLVSRGVTEAKHHGLEFGLENVKKTFLNTQADEPQEICATMLDAVRQFMATPPTHDDVTALALVRKSANS